MIFGDSHNDEAFGAMTGLNEERLQILHTECMRHAHSETSSWLVSSAGLYAKMQSVVASLVRGDL